MVTTADIRQRILSRFLDAAPQIKVEVYVPRAGANPIRPPAPSLPEKPDATNITREVVEAAQQTYPQQALRNFESQFLPRGQQEIGQWDSFLGWKTRGRFVVAGAKSTAFAPGAAAALKAALPALSAEQQKNFASAIGFGEAKGGRLWLFHTGQTEQAAGNSKPPATRRRTRR